MLAELGVFSQINNSKLFAAVIMILMNISSKYINLGLTKTQEEYLRHSMLRYFLIFAICWMATKDIFLALIMTAVVCLSIDVLFNEKSKFCVIPHKYRKFEEVFDLDGDGHLSELEIRKAEEVIRQAKKKQSQERMLKHLNYIKMSSD